MTQLTLKIKNKKDLEVLIPLLERLRIEYLPAPEKKVSATQLAKYQKIIAAGGDASYFGDAAEWQQEQRKERDLPFRKSGSA
ncbi:MAG: hypothetical protein IPJ82_08510 [Lewinellaceae bacterium]|nr:hypothetical protein [Lewinellaceae bacterium]